MRHESQLYSVSYFLSGRMNSLNLIFAITGSIRPAGFALSLSASVLMSVRERQKRESVAYA